jgi:hypothetical protein
MLEMQLLLIAFTEVSFYAAPVCKRQEENCLPAGRGDVGIAARGDSEVAAAAGFLLGKPPLVLGARVAVYESKSNQI